jgi:hypothetical protein
MRFQALVLAVALAACGQQGSAPAEAPEIARQAVLQDEIHRYDVMLGQVESLTADRPGAGHIDSAEPAALARSVREQVWQYNLTRSRLCSRGLFIDVSCGPPYQPVWIAEPADAVPSVEEVQTRATAFGVEARRLWDAVCADARTRETDEADRELVCMME